MVGNGGGTKRYAPWLQKALRIKDETHQFWKKEGDKIHTNAGQEPHGSQKQDPPPKRNTVKPKPTSIWEAVTSDDVAEVQRLIETRVVTLFVRREGSLCAADGRAGGGETLLHEAAFHGSAAVVRWLLHWCEAQSASSETLCAFVNSVDTINSQTTPLIAACQGAKGDVTMRLEIIQLLIHAGADVEHRDSHGDNAIHWCARNSNTVLLRWLLTATDAGANAVFTENFKRETPLDIAKRVLVSSAKTSHVFSAQSVVHVLRSVDRKCNMRLKMQVIKRHVANLHNAHAAEAEAQRVSVLALAGDAIAQAERVWTESLRRAEEKRKDAEATHVRKAAEAARVHAIQWLDTTDGKTYVIKQFSIATEELKLEISRGKLAKPKDMKDAVTHRACETYIHSQEESASAAALASFTAKRPLLPTDPRQLRDMLEHV